MQIKVADVAPAPAYNLAALENAFAHQSDGSGVFESSQHPIIVGQAAYNEAYGTNFSTSSYCNAPGSAQQRCDGLMRINDTMTFGFNTLLGPTTKMTLPIQPKAIHDEMNSTTFDEFGRMQANLGVEAQPPTPGLQNVTLYPYTNPATEFIDGTNLPVANLDVTPISIASDGTQIWRITHNGVDTHPIHFHLYDVQVINRVTWDNIIIPPDPNELGWKDTVRIAPLEDTIVALRPVVPYLPFEIPNSIRPLNPMMPLGSTAMFNNVNPNGIPTAPIVNQLVNFGWEYVYHCHILSHEEMDMMRPVTLALPPIKADGLASTVDTGGGDLTVNLSWNDNSIAETAYIVQRMENASGNWVDVGTIPSPLDQLNTKGIRQFADTTVQPNTPYQYRIVGQNTVGYGGDFPAMTVTSTSDVLSVDAIVPTEPPATPSNLSSTLAFGPQTQLQWTDNATNENGFTIQRCTGNGCTNFADIDGVGSDTTTYTDASIAPNATYRYRVVAFNFAGNSLASNIVTVAVPASPAAPTNLLLTVQGSLTTGPRVRVVFRDNQNNTNPETGFQVFRSENGGAFSLHTTLAPRNGVGNVTYYDYAVVGGNTYSYYIVTVNASSASVQPSNTAIASLPPFPAAPANFQATTQITNGGTQARVNMIWTDTSNNESRFVIQRATDPNFTTGLTTFNRGANTTSYNNTGLLRGTTYYYRIRSQNLYGSSEWIVLSIKTP
jgi:fibronectin type 3 domain-containing protein